MHGCLAIGRAEECAFISGEQTVGYVFIFTVYTNGRRILINICVDFFCLLTLLYVPFVFLPPAVYRYKGTDPMCPSDFSGL